MIVRYQSYFLTIFSSFLNFKRFEFGMHKSKFIRDYRLFVTDILQYMHSFYSSCYIANK